MEELPCREPSSYTRDICLGPQRVFLFLSPSYLPACAISLPLTLTNPSESYREHTSLDRAVALAAPHQHKPIWLCHSSGWSQALGDTEDEGETRFGSGYEKPTYVSACREARPAPEKTPHHLCKTAFHGLPV